MKNTFSSAAFRIVLGVVSVVFFSIGLFLSSSAHAFTLNSSSNDSLSGWASSNLTFLVNPQNCPSNISDLVNQGLAVWNSVGTSSLTLSQGGSSSATPAQLMAGSISGNPVIVCDTGFGATTGVDPNYIAGLGYDVAPTSGGNIEFGFLILNVEPGASASMSSLSNTTNAIVIGHEVGHVLGFGHSADTSALMYYNVTAKTALALAQDDIDAITYLYPRNELGSDPLLGGCGRIGPFPGGMGGSGLLISFLIALPFLLAVGIKFKPIRAHTLKTLS